VRIVEQPWRVWENSSSRGHTGYFFGSPLLKIISIISIMELAECFVAVPKVDASYRIVGIISLNQHKQR
jgi:hypothetical protein